MLSLMRILLFIVIAAVLKVSCAILDSRCYLEGGGSAESFLASEDMAVGSIVGKLRVNGNPSEDDDVGDINLSLREKDSPVKISPGTKNLVLVTPLDKEGVKGPASVYVDVICDRRFSTDPSFVIPVNVRVTDVNDNAPQWVGAPYSLSLSEVTVPGTRILQGAKAVDDDQQGPFSTVEYQILPGPYSEYVQFLNPLDGTLVLRKPLDYEALKNFTIRLRAQDQGTPPKFSDTTLRVNIIDADDQNPKFLKESYKGELLPEANPAQVQISPEPIRAVDQDEGIGALIQYSIVQSPESKYFKIDPQTAELGLAGSLGPSDLSNPVTVIVKATQVDNSDRYAFATVTVTRRGTHSEMSVLSFVQPKFSVRVREDADIGTRILALPTNKPRKHLKYYIPDPLQAQFFSIGALGELILNKQLDYEKFTKHNFDVVATDGVSNATAEVLLDVMDVNDWEPRFRLSHYEFAVVNEMTESGEKASDMLIGKLEAADGDRNDKLIMSLKGQYANSFDIDSSGNIWMHPEQKINQSIIHLIATATDSGVPPRSTSVPVTITMDGLAMAQTSWSSSLLGLFGLIVVVFVIVILALSFYILRFRKSPRKSRNRVHSHAHSTVSSADLVTNEKEISNGNPLGVGVGITMSNPINAHGGSGSSLSAGASTILAASLEREAQREREQRERENYTATVRSIVSRASVAHGCPDFDPDIDRDSIVNVNNRISPASKKLNWQNGKEELMSSADTIGSVAENNLTVYF